MPVKLLGGVFIRVTHLEQSISFYSALGLRLRGIEEWNPGRGATFFPSPEHDGWPLMTLIESDTVQVLEHPAFSLNATDVKEMHKQLGLKGFKVTELEEWTSPWNHHYMFDVYDPDGHPITLIEVTPLTEQTLAEAEAEA